MDTKVKELISASISKIHELADAETVIGEPIVIDGNITIIPVSKVSYGFAAGGSDLPSKSSPELFGGASGAGVTIQPLAFIVVNDGNVQLLQMNLDPSTSTAIINMVPEVFNKVQSLFKKDKCDTKKVSKKSKAEGIISEKDDIGEFDF
jgi:sporulation protein YtfJ